MLGTTLLRRLGHALSQKQEAARGEQPPGQWWDLAVGQMQLTRDELHHILPSYFPEWESHPARPHEQTINEGTPLRTSGAALRR